LKSLNNPPKYCKQIIQNHFFDNGKKIIDLLHKYLENEEIKKTDLFGLFQNPSKGFLLSLEKIILKLSKRLKLEFEN
jgi:hypothetical protein